MKYKDHRDFLEDFIPFLEGTPEESWCTDVVRSGQTNCLFGHLANFVGPKDNLAPDFDWFEVSVSTTYKIYPVNDGKDPDYPQATPKQRCLAYLRDLQSGKELTTLDQMEVDYQRWRKEMSIKYVKGNAVSLFMELNSRSVVFAHGCNCFCRMGRGIAKEVKERLPQMFSADCETSPGDRSKLGTFTYHDYSFGRGVNLYTQYTHNNPDDMLKLWAVKDGFTNLFKSMVENKQTHLVIPKIGAGLARGHMSEKEAWAHMTAIIESTCPPSVKVTVVEYDPNA